MIIVNTINKNHLLLDTVQVPYAPCPLCGAGGNMEMRFYQVQLEAGWVRNTKQITASAHCHHCNQDVPTVRWNKELDDFYKNQKEKIKVTTSFKAGRKGKFLIRLNIIFFGAVILFLAGLFLYQRLTYKATATSSAIRDEAQRRSKQYMEQPRPGDLALVYLIDGGVQTLFKVTAVDTNLNIIKAIPSTGKTFAPSMTYLSDEEAFSYVDFDNSRERSFSLRKGYEYSTLITTDGEKLGTVSLVFRK